jgi:DNA polymerase III delta prime subunit
MEGRQDEFLWVEKYRPRLIEDCILPQHLKSTFEDFVKKDEIPNMLLTGTAGTGKTTVARALCEELGCDYLLINCSEDSGIDTLRTRIRDFASTSSLSGKTKVVILDEADYLNPNSTQPALRGFIEEFSKNCRFVLTCNYANRIIPPLHSRTTVIEFRIAKTERPKIAAKFMSRVKVILTAEGIEFNEKVVAEIVGKHFPDYRRILNELQRYSVSGKIDEGILSNVGDAAMKELITSLREKDFKKMRSWVVNNLDNDPVSLFRKFYDHLLPEVKQVPQLVLLLADYSYKSAFCADQEINLVACLTEIMAACELKN